MKNLLQKKPMKWIRSVLPVLAIWLCWGQLSAQERSITGKVSDEAGQSIPGVNIVEKGSTNGTTTDASGNYSIGVNSGDAVLVFSFIGYATQEVKVGNTSIFNVTLQPDVTSLEEVVVTALGVQKESKRLGYSATSV